jgi:hypothetical protein
MSRQENNPLTPPFTRRNSRYYSCGCLIIALAFGLGVFIGLVVLGWWLWPVRWTNIRPNLLERSYQITYITLVADSYAFNNDPETAKARLASWDQSDLLQLLNEASVKAQQKGQEPQANSIQRLRDFLSRSTTEKVAAPSQTPTPQPNTSQPNTSEVLVQLGCVFFAGFILSAVVVLILRYVTVKSLTEKRGIAQDE